MNYCVAGIHTGIGKTVCSAVLCEALGYDYWKPVQAGDLEVSDSIFIKQHVSNKACKIHPERFRLNTAASPHYAAQVDGIKIDILDFKLPTTDNGMIIETAGGIMSPLSETVLNIDLIKHIGFPVILVSNNYLGSINHTLLSIDALNAHQINISGIVFVGNKNEVSENFILNRSGLIHLFSIPQFDTLNSDVIHQFVNDSAHI